MVAGQPGAIIDSKMVSALLWSPFHWSLGANTAPTSMAPSAVTPEPTRINPVCTCNRPRSHPSVEEIDTLDVELHQPIAANAPQMLAIRGAHTEVAGVLLVVAGDNPERLRSEASFAALCGVSPLLALSGKTNRHRLNRGGDRHGNCALWWIVISRLRNDARTQDYARRRTAEGRSKPEIRTAAALRGCV